MIVGGGGVTTLPFYLGTAYNVLEWKIPTSLGCYVENESIPLKIIFIFVLKGRALAPLQIPASLFEGPIYLLLC